MSASVLEEEDVDPRVKDELEILNVATDKINKLENELDQARCTFRQLLTDSTQQLNSIAKKIGKSIEKARPYYVAKKTGIKLQKDTQQAAVNFQRATEIHRAARETISLAEQRLFSSHDKREFDSAWQEMLNHATQKVLEAEIAKERSEREHQWTRTSFVKAQQRVSTMERVLKSSINKSKTYFEVQSMLHDQLQHQKEIVEYLQGSISKWKMSYSTSLQNLETISDEIHFRRQAMMKPHSMCRDTETESHDILYTDIDHTLQFGEETDSGSDCGLSEMGDSAYSDETNTATSSSIELSSNSDPKISSTVHG